MKMNDKSDPQRDQELDRELKALFAVNPAQDFEARLRARVARESAPVRWNVRWMFAGAGALAAAAAAVVLILQSQGTAPSIEPPKPKVTAVANSAPAPTVEAPQVEPKAAQHRLVRRVQSSEPELFIAANEANALRRLFTGPPVRFPGDLPGVSPTNELQTPAIVIEPLSAPASIVIEPIELSTAAEPAGGQ
jgi:hypothetical protein